MMTCRRAHYDVIVTAGSHCHIASVKTDDSILHVYVVYVLRVDGLNCF